MSELKPKGRTKAVSEEKIKSFERKLERSSKVHHDLFRLDVANTKKNMSWDESAPNWVPVPHAHFYHSVTSDGKAQDNSVATAGHFHPIEVHYDGDKISGATCGEPMVMHNGKAHPYANDKHTHDMSYIDSEVVEKRTTNADAVKMIAQSKAEENKANSGISGMLA